jgi:HD domain-containing protein
LLVGSLVLIHVYVGNNTAFLNFYFLPVILAGFHLGRRAATFAAVLCIAVVVFFQTLGVIAGSPGVDSGSVVSLAAWAGFLVLTAYTVGWLAEQRNRQVTELTDAYITMLEILTFHLESSGRQVRGHSYRVASRSVAIARSLGMRDDEVEQVRVAALLHELSPGDPRLSRLFQHFPGTAKALPIARSMSAALDIVGEYAGYYEHVSAEWPVDHLRLTRGAKILAVADAFETLQIATSNRPPFSPWVALEEIERGKGVTFASDVVTALRGALTPEKSIELPLVASA